MIEDKNTTHEVSEEANNQASTGIDSQNLNEELSTEQYQNVIEALQQEIALLKQRLDEQIDKVEGFKGQYSRTLADFDNFRKRTQKEKEEIEQKVKIKTVLELLPVVDNFERARTQIKPVTEGEIGIQKSYQGVYKNLADSLKKLGVSRMRPEGQPFDPMYHEALLREPTKDYPEGVVIEQLQEGYLLGDQVIRHAQVKVAAAYEPTGDESEEKNL